MKFKFIAKDKISHLPKSPGIYAFKKGRNFLYIGKATNLKERVKNHFQQPGFRGNLFVEQADKVGYIKTNSEIEALILEARLIKEHQPKYNVMWRDDKNYFFVGLTKEDFPTVFITHQPLGQTQDKQKSKINYVGPFVEGRALKQTLNVLRRVFPYRTCKPYSQKPCLWYQLNRCPGPCLLGSKLAGEIPGLKEAIKKESMSNARNLKMTLEGRKNQALKNLKREMRNNSRMRDFEKAAKIRDQIRALEKVMEHTKIFWPETRIGTWEATSEILKKILKIRKTLSRIEAYDVSNIQGKNATGSMVTFIEGIPEKRFYRKFKIRVGSEPNDIAMLREVLRRRFQHPEWGWPDLILIDGGKAQLNAAIKSGFKNIRVVALAKKENKFFIEGIKEPIPLKSLPREIFNLILRLRDEAHRFAFAYHKRLRDIDLRENS